MMRDALHVSLHDDELFEELQLTTDLIIAASQTDRPLSDTAVDRLLGL
jgi:hypothetical protein